MKQERMLVMAEVNKSNSASYSVSYLDALDAPKVARGEL